MVFPVVIYGCESWTINKVERQRIDTFELWCWRRPLRVPWTARRCKQSILKEISLEYSLEGLMLKLKLQYFVHVMWRIDSLEKTWCWARLRAGEKGGNRGWDGWMASPTWWMRVWVNSRSWWWTGRPGGLQFMGSQRVGHDWATELKFSLRSWISSLIPTGSCLFLWVSIFQKPHKIYLYWCVVGLKPVSLSSNCCSSLTSLFPSSSFL